MIATIIQRVCAMDWSAMHSPAQVQEVLEAEGLLLRALRPHLGSDDGQMHLWLLTGSDKASGETLLLELTHGPYLTEPHGYPKNGRAYGQRVWVLRGAVEFFCTGLATPSVQVVRAGEVCDHPGGLWHRSCIRQEALLLIHQPHGSLLHPELQALSARSPQ